MTAEAPRLNKYGRELVGKVNDLAVHPLTYGLTGTQHLQWFRVHPDGRRVPVHNDLGQPLVSALTPRNPAVSTLKTLHALHKQGLIHDWRATVRRQPVDPNAKQLRSLIARRVRLRGELEQLNAEIASLRGAALDRLRTAA